MSRGAAPPATESCASVPVRRKAAVADRPNDTAISPVRAKLIEYLLEPVGPLGLVAIAAGTFGVALHRGGYKRLVVSLDDAARISAEQILELARYVEQCNPHTLQQIASLLASPSGTAGR
jgi:hypothetical protein